MLKQKLINTLKALNKEEEMKYKCCLCRKELEDKDCVEGYTCPMCKDCARSLNHYGSE